MLAALVADERTPPVLAEMACGSMRRKIPTLEKAFTGHFTNHHAFLLAKMLGRVDDIANSTPGSRTKSALSLTRSTGWTRSRGSTAAPPRRSAEITHLHALAAGSTGAATTDPVSKWYAR